MKYSIILAAALLAGSGTATLAQAQERPCLNDIREHCPAALKDRPALRQCLRDNYRQLSNACQVKLREMKAQKENAPPSNDARKPYDASKSKK